MLLFNSQRSNKGKKYIRKNDIDAVFAGRAEIFNKWFESNSREIISYLSDRNRYESDVFNEAYLKIYETVLYSGLELENYRAYFLRAYFTILIDGEIYQNRFCELLPTEDREDVDTEYFEELEEKQKKLESDILKYIYSKYSIRDFELFKMYMSLKPAVNYATLSNITGVKAHNIQRIVSKIKKDIRDNKEFSKRRKEVI